MLGSGFSRSADFILPLLEGEPSKHCLRLPELRTSTPRRRKRGTRWAPPGPRRRRQPAFSAQLAAPRAPIG
ncbi:hypothetical protein LV779_33980 [Streptomyces thinghirensis]|nr:hypothetical protein [Streptomyces thinghirensis]